MNAIAVFNPRLSPISGFVKFHQCPVHKTSVISFSLQGLPKNSVHGVHIHKYGITSLSDPCGSTCDHYNPHNKLHGSMLLYGNDRHAGDLCNNVKSDDQGNVEYVYEDPLVKVKDILGRSVVLHMDKDDLGAFRDVNEGSATTGNAGARIACAVIGIDGKSCA